MATNITPVQVLPQVAAPNAQLQMAAFPARVWDFSTIFQGIQLGMQRERLEMEKQKMMLDQKATEQNMSLQQAQMKLQTLKYYGEVQDDFMKLKLLPKADMDQLYQEYNVSEDELKNAQTVDQMMTVAQKMKAMGNDKRVREWVVDREAWDSSVKQMDDMMALFKSDPVLASEVDMEAWANDLDAFGKDPNPVRADGSPIKRTELGFGNYAKSPEMLAYVNALKEGKLDEMEMIKENIIARQTATEAQRLENEMSGLEIEMFKLKKQEYMDGGDSEADAFIKAKRDMDNVHIQDKWHQLYNDLKDKYGVEEGARMMVDFMKESQQSSHTVYSTATRNTTVTGLNYGSGGSGVSKTGVATTNSKADIEYRKSKITPNAVTNDYYDKTDGALSKTGREVMAQDYANNKLQFTNNAGKLVDMQHQDIAQGYDTSPTVEPQHKKSTGLMSSETQTAPILSTVPMYQDLERNNYGMESVVLFKPTTPLGDFGHLETNNPYVVQGLIDDGVIKKEDIKFEPRDIEVTEQDPQTGKDVKIKKRVLIYKVPAGNRNDEFFKQPPTAEESNAHIAIKARNPLNERPSVSNQSAYNTGVYVSEKSGNFAVFESMEQGLQSNRDLMNKYYNGTNNTLRANKEKWGTSNEPVTVGEVVETWCPRSDNPAGTVEAYLRHMEKELGVPTSTPVNQIPMDQMMLAMMKKESGQAYNYFADKLQKGYGLYDEWPGQLQDRNVAENVHYHVPGTVYTEPVNVPDPSGDLTHLGPLSETMPRVDTTQPFNMNNAAGTSSNQQTTTGLPDIYKDIPDDELSLKNLGLIDSNGDLQPDPFGNVIVEKDWLYYIQNQKGETLYGPVDSTDDIKEAFRDIRTIKRNEYLAKVGATNAVNTNVKKDPMSQSTPLTKHPNKPEVKFEKANNTNGGFDIHNYD